MFCPIICSTRYEEFAPPPTLKRRSTAALLAGTRWTNCKHHLMLLMNNPTPLKHHPWSVANCTASWITAILQILQHHREPDKPHDELQRYNNSPCISEQNDPLRYWGVHADILPLLTQLALWVLSGIIFIVASGSMPCH